MFVKIYETVKCFYKNNLTLCQQNVLGIFFAY